MPEQLEKLAEVEDPIKIKITDPEAIFALGLLGDSGRELVRNGIEFYFTRRIAEKLINSDIAV